MRRAAARCDYCQRPAAVVGLYEDGGCESCVVVVCDEHTLPPSHPAAPHASLQEKMTAEEYRAGVPWPPVIGDGAVD